MTFVIADEAPSEPVVTGYDKAHAKLYLRLLDADDEGAAWQEVAKVLLSVNPALEPDRARRRHQSHLARARWMTEHGYLQILKDGL